MALVAVWCAGGQWCGFVRRREADGGRGGLRWWRWRLLRPAELRREKRKSACVCTWVRGFFDSQEVRGGCPPG